MSPFGAFMIGFLAGAAAGALVWLIWKSVSNWDVQTRTAAAAGVKLLELLVEVEAFSRLSDEACERERAHRRKLPL